MAQDDACAAIALHGWARALLTGCSHPMDAKQGTGVKYQTAVRWRARLGVVDRCPVKQREEIIQTVDRGVLTVIRARLTGIEKHGP